MLTHRTGRCRRLTHLPLLIVFATAGWLSWGRPPIAWASDKAAPAMASGADNLAVFTATVAELVWIGSAAAALYFTGTVVFSLAQANLEVAAGGRPGVLADAQARILPALICFVVAVSANTLSRQVPVQLSGGGAVDATSTVAVWRAIAAFVINIVLFSSGAVMAVGFATGTLAGQVAVLTGHVDALSQVWTRLGLVIVTGVLTLASVQIANWIIQAVI